MAAFDPPSRWNLTSPDFHVRYRANLRPSSRELRAHLLLHLANSYTGRGSMSINIVVCIKQIIDPEIPPEQFRVDPASKRQIRGGALPGDQSL